MATFIPQVQGKLATVEAFQPDYGFIQGWLETKQGKYNTALTEINSVYSTLKNLPLTLDDNIAKRDQFFAQADAQIKKLAGTDLSLDQNLVAAKQVFNPLATNPELLEDFGITVQGYAVMNTANRFRNSGDEETRKRYNPTSVNYAALRLEEYKNASPERRKQIAGAGIKYVDNVNVMERATAIADKLKLDITAPMGTTADGAYDITARNGDLILGTLDTAIRAQLATDPLVAEYFNQQGYVTVQSELQERAKQIGYDAAQAEVLAKYVTNPTLAQNARLDAQKNKESLNGLYTEKEIAESEIESNGVVPGSPEHERYLKILQGIQTLEQSNEALESTAQKVEAGAYDPRMETAYFNAGLFGLKSSIAESAQVLSMRNAEIKRTPNEYFKMRRQHEYAIALADHNLANKQKYKAWEEENYGEKKATVENNPFMRLAEANPELASFLATATDEDGNTLPSLDAQKKNLNDLNTQTGAKQSAWINSMIALDPKRMEAAGITARTWGNANPQQKANMLKAAERVYNAIEESSAARNYDGKTLTNAAKLRGEYLTHASMVVQQENNLEKLEAQIIKTNIDPGKSQLEKTLYTLLLKPDGTRRNKKEFMAAAMQTPFIKKQMQDVGFTDYMDAIFNPFSKAGQIGRFNTSAGAAISQAGDVQDMIESTWNDFQAKINMAYSNSNVTDVRAPFISGSSVVAGKGAGGLNIPAVTATYTSGKAIDPQALPFTELYSAMMNAGINGKVYNGGLNAGRSMPTGSASKDAEAALNYLTQALARSVGKDNADVPRPTITVNQFAGPNKDQTAIELSFDQAWIGKNRVTSNSNTKGRPISSNVQDKITVMVPSSSFYAPSLGNSESSVEWNTLTEGVAVPVRVPGTADAEFSYSNGTLSFTGSYKVFDPASGKYRTIADPMVAGNAANPAGYQEYINARNYVWNRVQEVANMNALNKQQYNLQNGVKDPKQLQE